MHVRSIQHVKETDDDVEFATDMEEPVCEGSEEHNHQQERHPHGITVVYLGFLRIVAKETTVGWIINSLKLVLDAVSNTEQLWRSFRAVTAGKNGSY